MSTDADSRPPADNTAGETAANAQADGQAPTNDTADGAETASTEDQSPDAGPDAPRPGRRRKRKQRSFWRELPILIAVALLLAVIIKTYAIQAFYIPSGSMTGFWSTRSSITPATFIAATLWSSMAMAHGIRARYR